MTPQSLFDRCAYLMNSGAVSPREALDGVDLSQFSNRKTLRTLLRDLQRVFEDFGPEAWPKQLARVAHAYKLESA